MDIGCREKYLTALDVCCKNHGGTLLKQKNLVYFIALFFLLLVVFLIFTTQKEEQSPVFKDIDVKEARTMIEKGDVFVLDVRTPAEFSSAHIKGATLIPVINAFGSDLSSDRLLEARISEIPKDKNILIYCRTGQRGNAASKILINAGYLHVYNILGGISAWTDAGYLVVSSKD
jgi:rhodanese-related sulfurtransferase